jgi:bifunctional non-homologous end joining protein LigD
MGGTGGTSPYPIKRTSKMPQKNPKRADKLDTYRSKRDPAKTPEPMGPKDGPKGKKGSAPRFVIQEHHARALHWDLRLEHEGVFVSWALPKGLPDSPATNHLAVHTEDHPLEYGKFEGDIPEGEYGGGKVTIWDSGTCELEKWTDREVKVVFHGKRANGLYVLFLTGGKNWMIHRMDPPPEGFEPMPRSISPMLAVLSAEPPKGAGWAFEFKWDGVRTIVFVEGGRIRATSRNDKDMTPAFPELRAIGEFLGSRSAVLDGELVAFGPDGRPSFGLLQHRLHVGSRTEVTRRSHEVAASYLAFDLLYLEGRSLLTSPYDERRAKLESLELKGESFAVPPSFTDNPADDVVATAKERGLEGIVAKRRNSKYALGSRNGDWVKIKNFRTQEVVIGGWTAGKGSLAGSLGALLVGILAEGGLVYAGKVGTGFDTAARLEILRTLQALGTSTSPFSGSLPRALASQAHFVRPEIVGEVQYGEWTSDGHLRHPSWRGLRPDKDADQVVREE